MHKREKRKLGGNEKKRTINERKNLCSCRRTAVDICLLKELDDSLSQSHAHNTHLIAKHAFALGAAPEERERNNVKKSKLETISRTRTQTQCMQCMWECGCVCVTTNSNLYSTDYMQNHLLSYFTSFPCTTDDQPA